MDIKENVVSLIINLFSSAFFAILFLQSGIDKIIDRKNNLSWLKDHFSKTVFKNTVPFLLTLLTFFELMAGIFCFLGFFSILMYGYTLFSFIGILFSLISLTSLFFGQRLAKDYIGAADLAIYFIVAILAMFFLHYKI